MPLPQWNPCGTYVYPPSSGSGILGRVVHQRGPMPEIHAQTTGPTERQAAPHFEPEQIREHLYHLDRRQWWLWSTTVAVILLLTLAVASFAFPALLSRDDATYSFYLNQAVRALVGLVLVFSVYLVYQQVQLSRLRHEVADQMQSLAKVETLASEVYKLAALDQLTGLYNRRSGEQRLAQEISRAQRAIRGSDLAVRLGGDEFMALLPECRADEVRHVLGRLEGLDFEFDDEKIRLQYSRGWTDYASGETPQELLKRADGALYESKRAGKRKVVAPVQSPVTQSTV